MSLRVMFRGEVNLLWGSRSESESEKGVGVLGRCESRGVDPKRGDLPMARVKRL
jgi:hypothetical protein